MNASTYLLGGELRVQRIGFGAMRLTGQPANFGRYPDWEGGKTLLRRAVELGVNFIDTALSYGPRHNEMLIAEALYPYSVDLAIATKGGVDKDSCGQVVVDGSAATLRRQVDEARARLKLDRIELFQLHRVDPKVSIEASVAALAELQHENKIRHIGLSNIDLATLRRAMTVAPISTVQNRYNLCEHTDDMLVDFTACNDIAYLPYGPLGGDPIARGARLSPREAIRWLLARSPNIVVIPGTTSMQHLEENMCSVLRIRSNSLTLK